MPKTLTIDANLVKEVIPILDNVGIELDAVIRMTLKRIIKDQDISFITAKQEEPVVCAAPKRNAVEDRISKGRAISLFEAQGIHMNRNVTFASKNRSAYNYWANPFFSSLDQDWYIILNDWQKRELHLFKVPAGAIAPEQMVCRIDQKEKIDIQICYNDPTYTDNRSRVQFSKYLIKDIAY